MSLTRNCIFPWEVMVIHAGGYMCPCCAMNDTDYGDFLLDYIEPLQRHEEVEDVFNNKAIQALKTGLLTGNLRPMCQHCAIVPKDLIPIETLYQKVETYLKTKGVEVTAHTNCAQLYAYDKMWFGITNRCNLRCIYCNQSLLADVNPYFKLDFPLDATYMALDYFASKGIDIIETGAFGESTLHPNWYPVFHKFHTKHPDIQLCLNTNLCKEYTEQEIHLLAEHSFLRISIDTMDESLFAQIRKNGRLDLVKKNIRRIEEVIQKYHLKRPHISIDAVICNLTWKSMIDVSEYAFSYEYAFSANNYEERPNSIGYRDGILHTVERLSSDERRQIAEILNQIKQNADEKGLQFSCSSLSSCTHAEYNRFIPYEDNPILESFYAKYPIGTQEMHLDIVYDYSNLPYEGILISRGADKLELDIHNKYTSTIVREVEIYKNGKVSPKFGQSVLPGYRKKLIFCENKFLFKPMFRNDDVESILLQPVL